MRSKFLTAVISLLILASCKKTDETTPQQNDIENSFQLASDQALADNLAEDVNDVIIEALTERNLDGNIVEPTMGHLLCATITVAPQAGFPKTIVIDFGQGCTSPNGITRSGSITVVLSDSLRLPGSTAISSFQNYFVNGFKIEGNHTLTNISSAGVKRWRREVENGKITSPNGNVRLHESDREIEHAHGANTPHNILDDEFHITGTATITNPAGITRTSEILSELHKKVICANIDEGTMRIDGPNHYAVLDYGNGTCDRLATISIDGNPPRQILLP